MISLERKELDRICFFILHHLPIYKLKQIELYFGVGICYDYHYKLTLASKILDVLGYKIKIPFLAFKKIK